MLKKWLETNTIKFTIGYYPSQFQSSSDVMTPFLRTRKPCHTFFKAFLCH